MILMAPGPLFEGLASKIEMPQGLCTKMLLSTAAPLVSLKDPKHGNQTTETRQVGGESPYFGELSAV